MRIKTQIFGLVFADKKIFGLVFFNTNTNVRHIWYAVLSPDWKYAINLAGSEMVLTTNRSHTDRVDTDIMDKIEYKVIFSCPEQL